MGLSLIKIQIFLILSSKADFNRKMECLIPLFVETDHVKKDKALDVIETVFKMCTSDLIEAFHSIGYFCEEYLT